MNTDYPKVDILFFERPIVDLRRYAFKIAKELKSINPTIKLCAIALELPSIEERANIFVDYYFYRDEIKDIDEFINKSHVQVMVFTNYRIPDMEMIIHAKKNGVKTIMLQEGVIFNGQRIDTFSIKNVIAGFSCFTKAISYINILRKMCKYDNQSFIKLISLLVKGNGIVLTAAQAFSKPLICDYIFVMGEYWKTYYIDEVGYAEEKIRLIGCHDLDGFTPSESTEAAICYVATILVEDGTVERTTFLEFVKALGKAVNLNTKLYIKLHPRSDISLYDSLKDHNIEFVKKGNLPCVNLYIGHSSTLLGRALYESDNLILWKFPGEDSFYENYATEICIDEKSLVNAVKKIDLSERKNKKIKSISNVYWNNPNGAIRSAAEMIFNYLVSDDIQ